MNHDEWTFINQSAADSDEVLVAKINTANVAIAAATTAFGRDSEQAELEGRRLGLLVAAVAQRHRKRADITKFLQRVDWEPLMGEKIIAKKRRRRKQAQPETSDSGKTTIWARSLAHRYHTNGSCWQHRDHKRGSCWHPRTRIPMEDIFDGRLEKDGIHEHHEVTTNKKCLAVRKPKPVDALDALLADIADRADKRCLTDGRNFVWVIDGLSARGWGDLVFCSYGRSKPLKILKAIANEFDVQIDCVDDG
jgi:hypothetical protein